ncbi:MAG: hypothetical protein LC795_13750 [Acidobacteria bacterium]|nr:hypothetical protein [Acidobacteriota bacterium]MCA1620343.1 hypothetical protein [Acidobacteriota bacterium]
MLITGGPGTVGTGLISKSVRDLGHRNSYGLEEGMGVTAGRMRGVHGLG